jgi:NosR/NirI family nitrous oxide reductase transcriptional regulator
MLAKIFPDNCATDTCTQIATTGNSETARLLILMVVFGMLTIWLYKKFKNKTYLIGGSFALVLLSLLFVHTLVKQHELCEVKISPTVGTISHVAANDEFLTSPGDFEKVSNKDSLKSRTINLATSLLQKKTNDEFVSSGEKFTPPKDEFASATDEFTSIDSISTLSEIGTTKSGKSPASEYSLIYLLAILFSLLIIISYLIKYPNFRKTRGLFLIAAVAYLGFYKQGCPCMILSFQNTVLAALGSPIEWISMVWFLGLLPLTYFFGKIWCGWLCHLGALQDFLFQSPKLEILKSIRTQNILRTTRIVLLVTLITQLIITRSNLYIHYDPFKVAFNLFSSNTAGYVLLALLLISSVLIYRPFCRAVCPVGVILGWISLIPGARQLSKKDTCIDCVSCSKTCQSKAMIYENKMSRLELQDCILCGECMDSCKKKSLYVVSLKNTK